MFSDISMHTYWCSVYSNISRGNGQRRFGEGHVGLHCQICGSHLWGSHIYKNLFKVHQANGLLVVHWAGSIPFPPVSLQRQVVCLLLQPVFTSGESLHCFLVGSPSVPAEAGCLLLQPVFISGESLHCFLVGVQIKS